MTQETLQNTLEIAREIRKQAGIILPEKPIPSKLQNTDYDAIDAIRNSELSQMNKTPAHWKAYSEGKMERTSALMTGTTLHYCILEPEKLEKIWCVKADGRTKVGKAENEQNLNNGKILISEKDFEMMMTISEILSKDKDIKDIFQNALIERHYIFEWLGVICKCKPDIFKPLKMMCDLKFMQSAEPNKFIRNAEMYGYDRQAAFYNLGVEAHGLWNPTCKNLIIAIEKIQPYAYSIIEIDPFIIKQGREKARILVEKVKSARNAEQFPAYGHALWTL
jgi:exodeoxyribonuclease VIII